MRSDGGALRPAEGGAAMTVVYIDSVFALNALADYLLVYAAAQLAGARLRRGRFLLAALLGGAYAAAVFLPGLGWLSLLPVKLSAGVLMALAAFGGEPRFLRLTLLLFAAACGFAGCVLALGLAAGQRVPMENGVFYTNVDARVLVISAAAAYLVLTVVFRAAARRRGCGGLLVPVTVTLAPSSLQTPLLSPSMAQVTDASVPLSPSVQTSPALALISNTPVSLVEARSPS